MLSVAYRGTTVCLWCLNCQGGEGRVVGGITRISCSLCTLAALNNPTIFSRKKSRQSPEKVSIGNLHRNSVNVLP